MTLPSNLCLLISMPNGQLYGKRHKKTFYSGAKLQKQILKRGPFDLFPFIHFLIFAQTNLIPNIIIVITTKSIAQQ